MKLKVLGGALSVLALIVGSTVAIIGYFQTKADAAAQHDVIEMDVLSARAELAAWSELQSVQNELKITNLEITGFLRVQEMRELTASEEIELQIAIDKREFLQNRLRDLLRERPNGA